jgi:hypothetical protein
VGTRELMTVEASELRPGDRIRLLRPPSGWDNGPGQYEPDQWRVLDLPIRLAMTNDVAVRLGIRSGDKGISVRMPAYESVTVVRDP